MCEIMPRRRYWKDNVNLVQKHAVNSAVKPQMAVCANWTVSWLTWDITDETQLTKICCVSLLHFPSTFRDGKPEMNFTKTSAS